MRLGRPASDRNSTTCGILQDNEVAIPRGGINCVAHEYPALDVVVAALDFKVVGELSRPSHSADSSISVELRKWSCLALLS